MECLQASETEVWCPSPFLPLVQFTPRARSIASTGLDLVGVTDPPASLWQNLSTFDSIVSWYGAKRPEFRDAVSRFPFTFFTAIPPEGATPKRHAVDFYLDQARSLVPCTGPAIPRIRCSQAREHFVVIHPFSGSPRKNWPLKKFRALAAQLARDVPVYWCRGPEDPPLPGAVEIPGLYDLACWLARAQLYIGNDSGVTHLAAAVGTPVIVFFGPTDPDVWAPRGDRVQIGRFGSFVP